MRDVKPTDLLHHVIDLKQQIKLVKSKVLRYTLKEREFAAKIFPEMEEAGIIIWSMSEWGAKTKFPPKKKGSDQFRVIHNFIPINKVTIKLQYPTHPIDKVLETVIRPRYTCFFITDALNSYWAMLIRPGDEYKAGFVMPHSQYLYLHMSQGLMRSAHT